MKQIISLIERRINSYQEDLEFEIELMKKKRTNADIAKQSIKNYQEILELLKCVE
jgi:hypothetical protein